MIILKRNILIFTFLFILFFLTTSFASNNFTVGLKNLSASIELELQLKNNFENFNGYLIELDKLKKLTPCNFLIQLKKIMSNTDINGFLSNYLHKLLNEQISIMIDREFIDGDELFKILESSDFNYESIDSNNSNESSLVLFQIAFEKLIQEIFTMIKEINLKLDFSSQIDNVNLSITENNKNNFKVQSSSCLSTPLSLELECFLASKEKDFLEAQMIIINEAQSLSNLTLVNHSDSFQKKSIQGDNINLFTSSKPRYPCLVQNCLKHFSRKYDMEVHLRTHTKEKPYMCKKCQKNFSRSSVKCQHERICKVTKKIVK